MKSLRASGRRAKLGIALLALLVLSFAEPARADNDPDLEWWTIETRHFRITYESSLEPVARRVARLGESIHDRLVGPLGHTPEAPTELLLSDTTDFANGSASSLPYNQLRLFVTAPADLSPLHDYDDWYLGLLTHEYAHILHTDNISGVPAVANQLFGKLLSPNQAQPRWIIEGLAVVLESEFSSGGRIRSSLFDSYLRADVLSGKFASLDQISSSPARWPYGNVWYLYGSRFLQWVSETYGRDVLRAVATDYGASLAPFGINRAIRRQTGRSYEELYQGFQRSLERDYARQIREVRRRGLREGRRVTFHGREASYPRFVPSGARLLPDSGGHQLVYYRDDLNERAGVYLVRVPEALLSDAPRQAREPDSELVLRSNVESPVAFAPNGDMLFASVVPFKHIYRKTELFRVPAGQRAQNGSESYRKQLTSALRATAPSLSPDGSKLAFTANSRGTTSLKLANLDSAGDLRDIRDLVAPRHRFDQVYTPVFSPDGKRIAYSAWSRGGYRDIHIVEVANGAVSQVTFDRALDVNPAWSPDGSRLYFASDRTGIFNVYEYHLERAALLQVTNVRTMAVMPAVSPDGKLLAYVGYTSAGYDLYLMPLESERFLAATAAPNDRPAPYADPPAIALERRRYNPLRTLRPHAYSFDYAPGNFGGNAATFSTSGADIAGLHAISASVIGDPRAPIPQMSLGYGYGRMPFDLGVQVSNRVVPRSDFRISEQTPQYLEQSYSVRTSLSYRRPNEFATQSFGISYTASVFDAKLPIAEVRLDPNTAITERPGRGFLGTVHLGYGMGRVEGGVDTPGPARGYTLSLGIDVSDPITGSKESLYEATYNASVYLPMPWPRHHVLALRSAGGIAMGTFSSSGVFYVGGYNLENQSALDVITSGAFNGAFVLRGYPPSVYRGSAYLLQSAEYRFPIARPDAGLSTLPLYLRRIDGNLFLDYGGAFDDFDFRAVKFFSRGALINSPDLHTGIGGELWLGATVGYAIDLNLRLGYAFGFSAERIPGGQPYFVAASAF